MVDSMPRWVAPPSITSGIRPFSDASTWLARVGLISPLALADGAASGLPHALSRACIAGWAGTRSAMVCRPAVTMPGIGGTLHQRDDEGQRPWPMLLRKLSRFAVEPADALGRFQVRDVDDQRIEPRPSLGGINARHRFGVGGIGGEAVYGLGRNGHRLSGQH